MRVVIVGGVACGAKTAARLARVCPQAEIIMLERGPDLSYANCGFPFFVGGEVPNSSGLTHMGFGVARDADYFKQYALTQALTGHEAVAIDRENKVVTALVRATGERKDFSYDKLVLATGASPIRPNLPGISDKKLERLFTLWTLQDALSMRQYLDSGEIRSVVIVGAGLVGVETAEMLSKRGLKVTLIDALPHPLYALAGEDGGALLQSVLKKNRVLFYGSECVQEIVGEQRVRAVITDKREIPADMVLLSVGVRPNLELAKTSGLEMGKRALLVDEQMRTSDPDIYAGGDCVESRCMVTGRAVWQPMGSVANRQGRVIADSIAGLRTRFPGVSGTAIARVFNWSVGKTGITYQEAEDAGFTPEQVWVTEADRPGFMAGNAPLFICLVADKTTRRILGARVLGPGQADKRVDLLATAIMGNLTVEDLAAVDTAYAPPFSTAMDPVTHAANTLQNKINSLIESLSAMELRKQAEEGAHFTLLDVRTEQEIKQMGALPYPTLHIPLGELLQRMNELPREGALFILCKGGGRAWTAYTLLQAHGYKNLSVIEGGFAGYPYKETV